jgi:16S rRNA (cytosine1402-N4)-methyltransferase
MHVPVMVAEVLEYLAPGPGMVVLDATCGLGGHARAMAERGATVIACDRDELSLGRAKEDASALGDRIRFRKAAFAELDGALAAEGIKQLDGLLADLGVSRYQLTASERGFSLMNDGPLDMRMDQTQTLTAAEIVNYESEKTLADLIYQFGEERRSRQIARAIVRARPILTTGHLAKVIEQAAHRTSKLHPATQTFMALRIAVNGEMEQLDALLGAIPRLVKPGGRAAVITFMSLEDRKVKLSFQALEKSGRARILTRHVVRPAEAEIRRNAPSRSAKLRAVEIEESDGGPT